MNPKKTSVFKELIISPIAIAVLIFLFVVLLRSVIVILIKNHEVQKETNFARAKQAELESKRTELETTLASMETEEGLEKEIRNKFFVVKPQENIIVITDQSVEENKEGLSNSHENSLWKRFFAWIGFTGKTE